MWRLCGAFLILCLTLVGTTARAGETALIAAASDLRFALDELARDFQDQTGGTLRITYGSTGTLAGQIREGAPFDLFLSADESFIFSLADAGLLQDRGAIYGEGRLALFVPNGSTLMADPSLDDLALAVADGRLSRLAIAAPDHAPYGKRAEEALRHKGLWDAIEPRLVIGENVAQAAQFAASGNADAGIIAYALTLSPDLAAQGTFALIPADWHSPLIQRMALRPDAAPLAQQFYDYLQTPPAREILSRFGFALPKGAQE